MTPLQPRGKPPALRWQPTLDTMERFSTPFSTRLSSLFSTLILCMTVLLSGCSGPPAFKSTDITVSTGARNWRSPITKGQPRRLADFKGKAVIVFFGYTQCPDVCPTTLLSMREDRRPPRQRRRTRAGSLRHARPGA
jgi:cytochrome oxidase Cu insertion factor (SCO1/SenC/PrrC family)